MFAAVDGEGEIQSPQRAALAILDGEMKLLRVPVLPVRLIVLAFGDPYPRIPLSACCAVLSK